MRTGSSFRGRLRGELGIVGQELDLRAADDTAWAEAEHAQDGSHTDITCETLAVDNDTSFGGPWLMPQSAVVTPPYTIVEDQHDWNPRDLAHALVVRITTDDVRTFTGILTNKDQFRYLRLINVGNPSWTIAHNSSSSIAIYRIACPMSVDITVGSGGSVNLWYDAHAGNWRVVGFAGDVEGVITSSGGASPDDAQYIVGASNSDLTDEQVATSTTSISVTVGGGTATWERAALAGDVTASANSNTTTIANDAVSNAKLANMAAWTFKARNNASSGDPQDMALADVTEDASPAAGDFLLGFDSTGPIRKFDVGNIAGSQWSVLTNGDVASPELIFADGDVIMLEY